MTTPERTCKDPHHDGRCSWKWDGTDLWHRDDNCKWTKVRRISFTPQRFQAIAAIMASERTCGGKPPRCGWCGAYKETVDPDEPCAKGANPETGDEEYIGPHQFEDPCPGCMDCKPEGAQCNYNGACELPAGHEGAHEAGPVPTMLEAMAIDDGSLSMGTPVEGEIERIPIVERSAKAATAGHTWTYDDNGLLFDTIAALRAKAAGLRRENERLIKERDEDIEGVIRDLAREDL